MCVCWCVCVGGGKQGKGGCCLFFFFFWISRARRRHRPMRSLNRGRPHDQHHLHAAPPHLRHRGRRARRQVTKIMRFGGGVWWWWWRSRDGPNTPKERIAILLCFVPPLNIYLLTPSIHPSICLSVHLHLWRGVQRACGGDRGDGGLPDPPGEARPRRTDQAPLLHHR